MAIERMDGFFLFAIFATVIFLYLRVLNRSAGVLPPGPTKVPLLGNLLNAPRGSPWKTYADWSKSLGSDILHLNLAGQDIIVLNSISVANELLGKRSSSYSSRPRFVMMNELMGWSSLMSNMPYGERWRERRRLFTRHFHPSKAQSLEKLQIEMVRSMLLQLYEQPEDFLAITRYAVGSIALTLAYGIPIQKHHDPILALSEETLHRVGEAALPGTYLVDFFPLLKHLPRWMPGAGFQDIAEDLRCLNRRFLDIPFEATIRNMASGTAKASFVTKSLQDSGRQSNDEARIEAIKDTAAMVFAAGSDTTLASVHTFFLAMVKYPAIQESAQQELDRVLRGRFPEFSDQTDLPYITAIVKETLRWQPVAPLGVPHYTTEEDVYNGYRIPKDTMVMANAWAMLHDDKVYTDPAEFQPERFLNEDGSLNPNIMDPEAAAFGFGRRICPGSHIAISTLWLVVAAVLSTLQISKAVDENGVEIDPEVKYLSSLVNHPSPFKSTIKPRNREALTLLQSIEK